MSAPTAASVPPMNRICEHQNSDLQLLRLAAQRSLYASAKSVFALHAMASTVVAAALGFTALFYPGVKAYAAIWGVGLAILDVVLLTPWQKKLREYAALIQESFDCDVLGLPWQPIKVGKPVDHELVVERARRYQRREPNLKSLRDWYPTDVCGMPLFLACVICQRTNAWWDAKQRRWYGALLASLVAVLFALLLVIGVVRRITLLDLLVTAFLPLSSGMVVAVRQYRENSDAAARLERLKEHAQALWDSALKGAAEPELAVASRVLQDEFFDHRKRNVPVFDWLYWFLRSDHELQMHEAAAQLARELAAGREGDKQVVPR